MGTVCNSERFSEEFWNCADIAVVDGSSSPRPSPRPTNPSPAKPATPAPAFAVTEEVEPQPQPEPEPEPEPEPVPATPTPPETHEGESCGAIWQQCGGVEWTGATCCDGESVCLRQHEWYSQCVPSGYQFTSLMETQNAQRM